MRLGNAAQVPFRRELPEKRWQAWKTLCQNLQGRHIRPVLSIFDFGSGKNGGDAAGMHLNPFVPICVIRDLKFSSDDPFGSQVGMFEIEEDGEFETGNGQVA